MMEPKSSPGISVSLLMMSVLVLTLSIYASYITASAADGMAYIPVDFKAMSDLETSDYKNAVKNMPRSDHLASYYRNPDTRALTLAFLDELTGNYDVSRAILEESIANEVSPALAFALAYEESGFNPKAYNKNANSVDRGIFQLNSKSFPKLGIDDFYDIATNVRHGIIHLVFCLESGGNEVAALAVYNAGLGRVSKGGTPRQTLDYIYKILGYRDRLEALFEAQVVARNSETFSLASVSPLDETSAPD